MKRSLFLVFIMVSASVVVFSAEQNYNLKVIENDSTMGVLAIRFEIVDGPMRGERIQFFAVSELYKAVFERYLKPTSRVMARFDIDEQSRLWPSQIISIDGRAIDSLFR